MFPFGQDGCSLYRNAAGTRSGDLFFSSILTRTTSDSCICMPKLRANSNSVHSRAAQEDNCQVGKWRVVLLQSHSIEQHTFEPTRIPQHHLSESHFSDAQQQDLTQRNTWTRATSSRASTNVSQALPEASSSLLTSTPVLPCSLLFQRAVVWKNRKPRRKEKEYR